MVETSWLQCYGDSANLKVSAKNKFWQMKIEYKNGVVDGSIIDLHIDNDEYEVL